MRYTFEKHGKPTYFLDRYIYTYLLHMAENFNTPLLMYGENISCKYGGDHAKDTYSAKDQIKNGVASCITKEEILIDGETLKDLNFFNPPSDKSLGKLDPIYLGYFVSQNSFTNYNLAKIKGFHDLTHEWKRTHHIEQFDSAAYLVHPWLKYAKFGHATATNYASRMIRYGMLSRDEAVELVKKHDHVLDPRTVSVVA